MENTKEHEAWIEGTKMCRELDIDHIVMNTLKGFADSYKSAMGNSKQQIKTDFHASDFINDLRIEDKLKECYIVEYQHLKQER